MQSCGQFIESMKFAAGVGEENAGDPCPQPVFNLKCFGKTASSIP
jgi:hypothetical protein